MYPYIDTKASNQNYLPTKPKPLR